MDELQLIIGKPLVVDGITFRHPKVSDIIEVGEEFYLSAVNMFMVKLSDLMVELYECGIDYRTANPYDVFIALCGDTLLRQDDKVVKTKSGLPVWNEDSASSKRLGWLTGIPDFQFYTDGEKCFLYSFSTKKAITESTYKIARRYYSLLHFRDNAEKFNPGNEATLKFLVRQEKRQRELEKKRGRKSVFASKISSLVWASGLTFEEVENLYVYQFFDGLNRIGRIKEYDNVCNGYYTGNIRQADFKKIIEKVDWTL